MLKLSTTILYHQTFNRINPIHLKTDLEKMKDSRKALEIEVFIQGIKDKQEENLLVNISIILCCLIF